MKDWTDLFKWVVELNPNKAVIALLLGLSIFFGWNSYQTNQEYKLLFLEKSRLDSLRVNDTKECNDRIRKEVAECKGQFKEYRDIREAELKQLVAKQEQKLQTIYQKMGELEDKAKAQN